MSPQAVADPDELERFARELHQYNNQLQDITQKLKGQFGHLSSSWRDQEFQKFEQQFDQTLRTIQSYLRTSESQIPNLHKKARALHEYLGRG
jgi:uncharacterized protein YukE